ncbi:MAG TPA: MarR family winged helix-turn-helix transcriptional regulator [Ktedonobacterales bacterium]|nr:MarR family winged helix-turn-helix transcriptional regulator [Ktedonobacterales bacterium]
MTSTQPAPRMIGALLRIPFQATVARVHQRLREAGYTDLRPTHFTLLQHLRPEGVHVSELAHLAQVTRQSMGALVDYVEECGYVERMTDPNDGRAWLVRLTVRGHEVERIARVALAELEAEWARALGEERFAALYSTLRDLVTVIERDSDTR